MVPQSHTHMLLDLAHSHLLGGHLAVKEYCKSCYKCQMNTPQPHLQSLLVPLPTIEVPFERAATNLVRKLPKYARGHQRILVLDYVTWYPEAIPPRNKFSMVIAKKLFHMISCTGTVFLREF